MKHPSVPSSPAASKTIGAEDRPFSTLREAMLHDDGRHYVPGVGPLCERAAFTSDDEKILREVLRRCSPPTRAAACAYRRTRDASLLPVVIHGLIEHYVDRNVRVGLLSGADNVRLVEDLAIDSLTTLEIVFLAEEVLQVSIDNEELRFFRTVGEIKRFIVCKLAPASQTYCDFVGIAASGDASASGHSLSETRQLPKPDPYDKRQY